MNRRSLALLALVPLLALAPSAPRAAAQETAPAHAAQAPALLQKIVLLGASVTDGFGLDGELEAPADLALFVDAALTAPHGEVLAHTKLFFFNDPLESGRELVDVALAAEPSLLLGLDFLFWYGYGDRPEERRLATFEQGLEQLDRLECPIVVADLPDMRHALEGSSPLMGGGPMIAPTQIPAPETLAKLNARLAEWAAARPRVTVVPLARFVARLSADEALRVGEQEVPAGSKQALLQSDLLHTNLEGTAILTLLALAALDETSGELEPEHYAATTAPIMRGVMRATEEQRERRRARERRREERRAAREGREKEGGGGLPLR